MVASARRSGGCRPGFRDPSCDGALEAAVAETGSLDAPLGSDYFVFPKDVLGPLRLCSGAAGWTTG